MITRPLLASKSIDNVDDLEYPVLVSPKLDGIRCLKINGNAVTRNFKPIPNKYVRNILDKILPDGIDGEIMLRDTTKTFNDCQSKIMSFDGEPDFIFWAFDYVKEDLNKPFSNRYDDLCALISQGAHCDDVFQIVPHITISTPNELKEFEKQMVDVGYEGVMIRSLSGKYKCGRSTPKEKILMKWKRFYDREAIVIGFNEKTTNVNIKEKDAFGLSKRSSKKDGLVGADTLGSLIVEGLIPKKDISTKNVVMPLFGNVDTSDMYERLVKFNVGSGFDDAKRREIWDNQSKYLGKTIKYKYQEIGKDAPRFPVFLGFRHINDMS